MFYIMFYNYVSVLYNLNPHQLLGAIQNPKNISFSFFILPWKQSNIMLQGCQDTLLRAWYTYTGKKVNVTNISKGYLVVEVINKTLILK